MYADDESSGGRYKSSFFLHMLKTLPPKTKVIYLDMEASIGDELGLLVKYSNGKSVFLSCPDHDILKLKEESNNE